MGLYGDKKDYQELVKENISKAKLLYGLNSEDIEKVLDLLNKKQEIMRKNGFFSNIQLKQLDKKIEKIRKNVNKK